MSDLQPRRDELRRAFESEGLVHLPGFLPAAELSRLREELDRLHRDIVPAMPRERVYHESSSRVDSLKQLQQLAEHDPWFAELLTGGAFRDLAELLLDGPVVPRNLQWFNKPPGLGQPTPAPQDGYYFMLEPSEAVTIWLALDLADEENGCVRYVPRSHLLGMRPHGRTGTLGFSQGITDYGRPEDVEAEVAFPARPGDVLAHHALTIHRADGNRSAARQRRALGFIYYCGAAREDTGAHDAYQRSLADELIREERV